MPTGNISMTLQLAQKCKLLDLEELTFLSIFCKTITHPVTIYLIPFFTIADVRAFIACLTRLGFDIPTHELIDKQAGNPFSW
jgi:hypothetical protein